MQFPVEQLKKYPESPGVYVMKDNQGQVIYVGKAKNIRSRLSQYFAGQDGRAMVPFLVANVESIDTLIVSSEKEALLLENNLIKQYLPKYNALLKDDKSYIALKVNTDHEWPMISLIRYRGKPKGKGAFFGPYTSAHAARETLDLMQKVFPLRQCSDQELVRRTRPCVLYDMKRCIAPCVGKCTKEGYNQLVKQSLQFLKGHTQEVIDDLIQQRDQASERLDYELAGEIQRKIRAIEKTTEKQVVDKPVGIDIDTIGICRQGDEVMLVLAYIREGKFLGVKNFHFSNIGEDDRELIESFLMQNYGADKPLPDEILLPLKLHNTETLENLLSTAKNQKVDIFNPERGDKKKLIEMAEANAIAAFKKNVDEKALLERTLLSMQEKFHLSRYPRKIECVDISNLSGTLAVGSLVSFLEGKKERSAYRKFKIKSARAGDDTGSMYEVLIRRYSKAKEENILPDLLIVDGGKGQLNTALRVLKELDIVSVDVISLVKEAGRHDKGITAERVCIKDHSDPIELPRHSPILFFLQKVRDEAHRFAIEFQKKRRSSTLIKSALDEIPGIGPTKKQSLLKHFGSVKKIQEATLEQLLQAPKISESDAKALLKYFTKH